MAETTANFTKLDENTFLVNDKEAVFDAASMVFDGVHTGFSGPRYQVVSTNEPFFPSVAKFHQEMDRDSKVRIYVHYSKNA